MAKKQARRIWAKATVELAMTVIPGPTAPPAPQRPAYAQARIDVTYADQSTTHKLAIPPHSLVFGDVNNLSISKERRPENRLQPVNACGQTFRGAQSNPVGVVQDSMLDLASIHKHPGHRHVGVCVQGLVTLACKNEDIKDAKIGDYLILEGGGNFSFHGAPTGFKGLKFRHSADIVDGKTVGKIYGFSSTRANEVEVLLL